MITGGTQEIVVRRIMIVVECDNIVIMDEQYKGTSFTKNNHFKAIKSTIVFKTLDMMTMSKGDSYQTKLKMVLNNN